MKYGLIGEKLGHSYSKTIHQQLTASTNPQPYHLIELTRNELHEYLSQPTFHGINVTIPYKETVIPYLDAIDQKAKAIGSVNTILHQDGKLTGYNTDYFGFTYLLTKHQVLVRNAKVLILGSGGTSKTVQEVMKDQGAKHILIVSRTNNNQQENIITYEQVSSHRDADIIVNTTPIGMFPNDDTSPLDLTQMRCHTVIDVIYNPQCTLFLQQAQSLGKKAIGGLEMLVGQAVYASQLFHQVTYPDSLIHDIYRRLRNEKQNIVLIGMPGCGKTTIGSQLAQNLQMNFVDVDDMIEKQAQRSIKDMFAQDGEAAFRELESQIVKEVSTYSNSVISTGGGVVTNPTNMSQLRKNGLVVYIAREPTQLQISDTRPLSVSLDDNKKLFAQREPLYQAYSDYTIQNNGNINLTIQEIEEIIYEATCY